MKIKKYLVRLLAIIGIAMVFMGFYGYRVKTELSKMAPLATKEIVSGVYSIFDSYVNMYLIKSNDNFIAIDAGNNLNNIKKELIKLNVSPEKVVAIFLTHTDYDHIGALKLFKNAKVYISSEEEQMINGKTARTAMFIKNKLNTPYQIIKDNETIDITNIKVKGILNPGHTPGSMSYVINGKYIFGGDTLSLNNGKVELFNDFFNMDSKTEAESIKKLAGLSGINYIFTAHYGYTDNFEKAFANWK